MCSKTCEMCRMVGTILAVPIVDGMPHLSHAMCLLQHLCGLVGVVLHLHDELLQSGDAELEGIILRHMQTLPRRQNHLTTYPMKAH